MVIREPHQEVPPVWKLGYRYSAGESNCPWGLIEDTISDAENLKECDRRSDPDRRCVVCQRDPVLLY